MPDSLKWNWMPPERDRGGSYESLRDKLEIALAADGGNELLQLRVVEARIAVGELEAAVELGSARAPGKPAAGFAAQQWDSTLAKALLRLGRFDDCLSRLDAALEIDPDPDFRMLRIEALWLADRKREALRDLDLLRGIAGIKLRQSTLELMLRYWEPEEVLARLDEGLNSTSCPGDLAEARIACLQKLGRADEIAAMVDPDRHVSEVSLPAPPSWQPAGFRDALLADIGELGDLLVEPVRYSTRGGKQTRSGLPSGRKAIAALTVQLQHAVEHYCEALPEQDPIRRSRPERPVIVPWVVVLDREGYQNPHIHADAWLSGVYYVTAPETDLEDGTLRIGLPRMAGAVPPWPARRIAPEPGKLVLFPSFLRHDTTPHRGNQPRISIAFDIVRE